MRRRLSAAGLVAATAALALPASAAAAVSFATAPALPTLPSITLTGARQTTATAMANFAVTSTAAAGWNVTVAGQGGGGRSAVFKQYCPSASCGTDPSGYVAGGYTLPASSLMLDTTGASWTTGGTRPAYQCAAGCPVDGASATKIASASTSVASGTWTTTGFSATSLTLTTPSTLRKLPAGEVYRANVVWTLNTGP